MFLAVRLKLQFKVSLISSGRSLVLFNDSPIQLAPSHFNVIFVVRKTLLAFDFPLPLAAHFLLADELFNEIFCLFADDNIFMGLQLNDGFPNGLNLLLRTDLD